MSAGPDIAGLYAALARVNPQQRATYRLAAATHRAAGAMAAGRRYRTRDLPRSPGGLPRWRSQPRDPVTGRFVKA